MAPIPADTSQATIFLLSPARCNSPRATRLADGTGESALAKQLSSDSGAPLGDVFAFLSSLYFRGKLAYARKFARHPRGLPGVYVITPGDGLRAESQIITAAHLRAFAEVEVHHANEQFVAPLSRDAQTLAEQMDRDARFILLGSIASAKYLAPLQRVLGDRLLFPAAFVGRGDMSRGGLLLRSVSDDCELEYLPVAGATLHGVRPPRLAKRPPPS